MAGATALAGAIALAGEIVSAGATALAALAGATASAASVLGRHRRGHRVMLRLNGADERIPNGRPR